MDFKDALKILIDREGYEIFNNIFRARSLLLDYVRYNPYQIKLIYLFCDIYNYYNLYEIFKEKGLEKARHYLILVFHKYKDSYSFIEYKDAINPISEIIYPEEYKNSIKEKIIKNEVIIKRESVQLYKYQNIKGLNIKVSAKSLRIISNVKDEIKIYKDSEDKLIDLNKYEYINNNLSINLKKNKNNIIINIPKKLHLLNLSIISNNTPIEIPDLIYANKCNITNKKENILVNLKCNNLSIDNKLGYTYIKGNIRDLNVSSTNGNITFELDTKKRKNINLNIQSNTGCINGIFEESIKMSLIRKLFMKRRMLMKEQINNCKINFNLTTNKGKIRIL